MHDIALLCIALQLFDWLCQAGTLAAESACVQFLMVTVVCLETQIYL